MTAREPDRFERGERALKMLAFYRKANHLEDEPMEDVFADALADLMHAADSAQVPYQRAARTAAMHYAEEIRND